MNIDKKIISVLAAGIGCVLIILYFRIAASSDVAQFLVQNEPKNEILTKAEDMLANSEFADYDIKRRIDLDIDDSLLRYAQTVLENEDALFLPIAKWKIRWSGIIHSKKEETQKISYTLAFDFNGNLTE
ncbi:MAG: hypothetical protein ACE5IR_03430, partial [bacterium]